MFSKAGIYGNVQYFWIAGALTPVLFWFMAKKWPRSGARYLHAPIIFGGTGMIPPYVIPNCNFQFDTNAYQSRANELSHVGSCRIHLQ
jgi:OPT oligopeptide transporter protein